MGFGAVLNAVTGAGGIKDLVLGILDRIKLAPEKKAEIELKLAEHEFEIQKMELEMRKAEQAAIAKELETASANITAEAQSGDAYTRRARPSFMYMMILIMLCNYLVFPLINKPLVNYPEPLFWLFGSAILGYTGARTWEKIGFPSNKK